MKKESFLILKRGGQFPRYESVHGYTEVVNHGSLHNYHVGYHKNTWGRWIATDLRTGMAITNPCDTMRSARDHVRNAEPTIQAVTFTDLYKQGLQNMEKAKEEKRCLKEN